jgi:hypothetical protein
LGIALREGIRVLPYRLAKANLIFCHGA